MLSSALCVQFIIVVKVRVVIRPAMKCCKLRLRTAIPEEEQTQYSLIQHTQLSPCFNSATKSLISQSQTHLKFEFVAPNLDIAYKNT